MRIKDIPNFYEKTTCYGRRDRCRTKRNRFITLWHIGEDDPRLEELQNMLAVKEGG